MNILLYKLIGFALFREKEKAEIKDRKVLGILAAKDDKIDELQKVIATQGAEVSAILAKYVSYSLSNVCVRDNHNRAQVIRGFHVFSSSLF